MKRLLVILLCSASAFGSRVDDSLWSVRTTAKTAPSNVTATASFSVPTPLSIPKSYITDNDPETLITLSNATEVVVDLGQPVAVHRVYFASGDGVRTLWPNYSTALTNPPLGLVAVFVGDSASTTNRAGEYVIPYDAGDPIITEADIRFSPVSGRFVRLQLQTSLAWGTNYWPGYVSTLTTTNSHSWKIAELEVYGSGPTATNAVLIDSTDDSLKVAASDLSYYLGELTGQPHPIITSAETNSYTGTLYSVVDLKSLAPDWSTMTNNMATGVLPTNEVNVSQSGRVVAFTGWPYRCVLWSVWEFLERQGVRWLAPDSHGDYVPTGQGVDLGILPLTYSTPAKVRYASWDNRAYLPWPYTASGSVVKQNNRQEHLFAWRNRWTDSWNVGVLSYKEIPAQGATGVSLDSQYSEGFDGYPHNLNTVLPSRILATNSAWWGSRDGTTFTNVGVQFELANSGAADWIYRKLTNWVAYSPIPVRQPLKLHPAYQAWNLAPMDAVKFSIGPEALAANAAFGGDQTATPWRATRGSTYSGGSYYKLLSAVASNAPSVTIGGLAYADVFDPPAIAYPPNVRMEVTLWGAPNLPYTAQANTKMWTALTNWQAKASQRAHYDYTLLFVDYWQDNPRVPVPLVSAVVSNAAILSSLGMLECEAQAFVGGDTTDDSFASTKYNPWAFYAYPRTRWNTNVTADDLLTEFFTGYYSEAEGPMRSYYDAMESWITTNNVDLHNLVGFCYWVSPGSFPRLLLEHMRTNLVAAQSAATNWVTTRRVHDATNSWWYCVTNQGLSVADLTDFSALASVPDDSTLDVPLGSLSKYWPTRSIAGYYYTPAFYVDGGTTNLQFNGAAIASVTLRFEESGNHSVEVVSYCIAPASGEPKQTVWLGTSSSGEIVISTNTTTSAPATNTFTASVPAASAFDLVVVADAPSAFLRVKSIKITKQ